MEFNGLNDFYDYKKYAILYVDDEEKSLKFFKKTLKDRFQIFTAKDAKTGYEIFLDHQDDIGIVLSDQKMPGKQGTELLADIRKRRPRVLRILVTAYSNLDAAIMAINKGAIYKYITKPWNMTSLEITLMRGLEFFILQKERDQLATDKISALHKMMIRDRIISFGLMSAGLQHHIRNAMVAVKTFLSLAPKKLVDEIADINNLNNPEFWTQFYNQAENQMNKIVKLLDDIGDISEKPILTYNDHLQLYKVINNVIEPLQSSFEEKNIYVENNVSNNLPVLTVDKLKFYRIFELLLKDQAVCLPEGSHIVISGKVFNKPAPDNIPWIEIIIQDNSPALSKDALRSVFDPFFLRGEAEVSEFGLYLMASYFMVYHHNGEMDVKSDSIRGNTFTIKIPTKPYQASRMNMKKKFFQEILLNESLWEKVLSETV